MTLPLTGRISASMINLELGRSSNAPFSLSGSAEKALAGKATTAMKFSDFYGKSAAVENIDSIYWQAHNSITGDFKMPVGIQDGDWGIYCYHEATNNAPVRSVPGWGSIPDLVVSSTERYRLMYQRLTVADSNKTISIGSSPSSACYRSLLVLRPSDPDAINNLVIKRARMLRWTGGTNTVNITAADFEVDAKSRGYWFFGASSSNSGLSGSRTPVDGWFQVNSGSRVAGHWFYAKSITDLTNRSMSVTPANNAQTALQAYAINFM